MSPSLRSKIQHARTALVDYVDKFETIRFRREDGILEVTVHTDGGSLRWGRLPHAELEQAFLDIARDRDNQVVILTGTGAEFSGPAPDAEANRAAHRQTSEEWGELGWESKNLLTNLMAIDVPMIAAVNGPALRHAEMPVMCDVVLASETAAFQDSAHFVGGLVPGDGMHIVFPLVMGYNRGRYFLLTGQKISAQEAKDYGVVNEVLAPERLLPRAWEIARQIMQQPELNRRYTRILLTEVLRRQINELLPYGLALEGLALIG
jgi:enoyl-CoA hydratase/carnithine racemase